MTTDPLFIYLLTQRTVARSHQLEVEERNKARGPTNHAPDFSDEPEEHSASANLLRDDQIDFLDHEDEGEVYHDEFTDDEDVFRYADGDEEDAISLERQPPRR